MKYEPCSSCGGEVVDGEPHFIPLGTDNVLKIIDQECKGCGAVIIGEHQKMEVIKNQKVHDELVELLSNHIKR